MKSYLLPRGEYGKQANIVGGYLFQWNKIHFMAGIGETAPSTNPLLAARGTEQTNSHAVKVLIDTGSTLCRVGERMARVSS